MVAKNFGDGCLGGVNTESSNMKKLVLIAILGIALVLRVVAVAKVPPGLSNDEISIAYNAYSVLKTGKDEYGKTLPVSFRSHDTYKAPLYIYLAVPSIAVFGNNELAVRLPSIIFGVGSVLALYFLAFQLTASNKFSLASAFLLAITPWHIYTSRVALEANLALFLLISAVYLFVRSLKKPKLLYLSTFVLGLSMYAYHTEWVFSPLILLVLIVLHRKKIFVKKNHLYGALGLLVVMIMPLVIDLITRSGGRERTEFLANDFVLNSLLIGKSLFQKAIISFEFWGKRYLNHLSFSYLFFNGLEITPGVASLKFGLFNLVQLPAFVYGLYLISRRKYRGWKIMIAWLLLGPFIPSLTLGEMNLVRNLVSIVPITVISAVGLSSLDSKAFKMAVFLFIFNLTVFVHHYFTHFPIELSENWSYGFKQIASYVKDKGNKYNSIVIDPNYGTENPNLVGVPGLFILYFNQFDPQRYLEINRRSSEGLSFDKYEIRKVDWPKEKIEENSLYIVGVHSVPVGGSQLLERYSINLLNGKKALVFYETY
jgi:hypothetical protein